MTPPADDEAGDEGDDISAALAAELSRVAETVGQPPTKTEFDDHSDHNPQTYVSEFGSWVAALRTAGLDPSEANGGRKKTAESELIEELERLAEALDRAPQVADMNSQGEYSAHTYKKRFGSWSAALEAVGHEPNTVIEVSREELIDEMERLAEALGHPPRTQHMDTDGKYSSSTYQSRFGGWQEALDAAGFDPFRGISEDELLAAVMALEETLGRPPTSTEFNTETPHSATTCKEKFGSWRETLRKAGLDPAENTGQEYSDEELIDELRRLHDSLDHAPSSSEMDEGGEYSAGVYQHRFGSWGEALDTAQIDSDTVGKNQYSTDDLTEEMRRVGDEVGHPPRTTDMEQVGDVSPTTFVNRFGSWDEALESAGFDSDQNATGKQYTEEELLAELRRLADASDGAPTTTQMESEGEYAYTTFVNRFGSWSEALEEAGVSAE